MLNLIFQGHQCLLKILVKQLFSTLLVPMSIVSLNHFFKVSLAIFLQFLCYLGHTKKIRVEACEQSSDEDHTSKQEDLRFYQLSLGTP